MRPYSVKYSPLQLQDVLRIQPVAQPPGARPPRRSRPGWAGRPCGRRALCAATRGRQPRRARYRRDRRSWTAQISSPVLAFRSSCGHTARSNGHYYRFFDEPVSVRPCRRLNVGTIPNRRVQANLWAITLRSSILADGAVTARDAERIEWDVIVVGTGMGGGTLGLSAGPSGTPGALRRKGTLDTARDTGHDSFGDAGTGRARGYPVHGRPTSTPWPAADARPTRSKTSAGAPPSVSCRSSAAEPADPPRCTGWCASDFSPGTSPLGRTSPTPAIPPCRRPGRSPTSRCGPGTPTPRSCWGSAASPIRCGPKPALNLPAAPPFSTDNQPLVDYLTGRGLHPYHLPMACDYTADCATCQTFLCSQPCKNDAARNGVLARHHRARRPAVDRVPGRAPGSRPHPGPKGDLRAPVRSTGLDGEGGGAGRRRAGNPGAAAQFPVGRLAARAGQRLRHGGPQPDAPSSGSDQIWPAAGLQDHRRQQGDRAQRFLLLRGPEVRDRAVVWRHTADGVADQPPRPASEGATR